MDAATKGSALGSSIDNAYAQTVRTNLKIQIRFLVKNLGRNLVAYIVGATPKTVGTWMKGTHPRAESEERIRLSYQAFKLIEEREDSSHTARAWFVGINPALGDQSPARALSEGRTAEVYAAAKSFVAGG